MFFSHDLIFIFIWWLALLVFGLSSLPITILFFNKFWDKGYIFSKTIGLIVISYLSFSASTFHFFRFDNLSLWSLLGLWFGFNWLFLTSRNSNFFLTLRNHLGKFILLELCFVLILVLWSYVRGFQPEIEGLEKFMDWGFVNSTLRSVYFPPIDMWFAREPINYYYFGHLIFALLTKFTRIPSTITYNLAIATCATFTFSSGLSLASNLAKSLTPSRRQFLTAGLVSALLLTFGGNLHPLYKITKLSLEKHSLVDGLASYWYPDATRFIGFDPDVRDKTIHEFPSYSFIVADLHGHMNDIMVVLLMVAILLHMYLSASNKKNITSPKPWSANWVLAISYGFLLSVAYMTNAWDFFVYGLLFALALFLYNLNHYSFSDAIINAWLNGLLVIGFKYFFNLPFSIHFIPMVAGPTLADMHSPFWQLAILYGGFWLLTLPVLILLLRNLKFKTKATTFEAGPWFFVTIFAVATLLIIIPEIVYLKDIYVFDHRRANTMFKLVYQAFMLYSLLSGFALVKLSQIKSHFVRLPLKFIFLLVFLVHLSYLYFGLKGYYGFFSAKSYQGLYGFNFVRTRYPDNFAAINWLNQLPGQPTILEAVGDSYTDYGHISISTGLPTVQGWVVHEWLWRNGYDKPAARQTDVAKIYESSNPAEVSSLLNKYGVQYIFLGPKEQEKYTKLNESNFQKLGYKIAFSSGSVKIYQVN